MSSLPDDGPLTGARPRLFVAAFMALVSVAGTFGAARGQPFARPVDAGAVLLALVSPLAIVVLLPRRPAAAVVASVAATAGYLALGYPWGPVVGAAVLLLVVVILAGPRRRARTLGLSGAGLLAGAVVAAAALRTDHLSAVGLLLGATWAAIALNIALRVRERTSRRAELRAAEQRRQAERQATAVTAERLRIARELHDVLAHSLSAISVQAGVGLHLLDRDPAQARSALTNIRSTSIDALDEVRAVLGVVRSGPDDEGAPRTPLWTLAALPRLVALARTDRLTATLDLDPQAHELPEHLAGVVYRVVQESLTNVRRHAPAATRVEVRVAIGGTGPDRVVTVTVRDAARRAQGDVPGPGTAQTGAARPGPEDVDAGGRGYGLPGMRERVESVGGTLDAGPAPGGWRVHAVIPWPPAPSPPPPEAPTTGVAPDPAPEDPA